MNKVRKIDKNIAAVAEAASNDPRRRVLQGVHINGNVAEATDGRVLLQTMIETVNRDDLGGLFTGEGNAGEVIVPTDIIKRGAYLLGDTVQTSNTDSTITETYKPIEAEYPNTNRVIPDWIGEESSQKIMFSVKVLDMLIKAAKKAKTDTIMFNFPEKDIANEPVGIKIGEDITGVAMPRRIAE